jgi:hypothetical protein
MATVIRVRQLGLAAFIKMNGAALKGIEEKEFLLETEIPLDKWRLDYNNSCCIKHDALVCELRHFLR